MQLFCLTAVRRAAVCLMLVSVLGCQGESKAPDVSSTQADEPGLRFKAIADNEARVLKDTAVVAGFLEHFYGETNDLVRQRDYVGRVIELTGTVGSVSYGEDGLIYVVVWPGMKIDAWLGTMDVAFHFGFDESHRTELAALSQGAVVTMRGTFDNLWKAAGEFNYRAVLSGSESR